MAKKDTNKPTHEFLFGKRNYIIMLIGIVIIAIGFALMAGGGSDDPAVFNEDIYNFQRIRLAPTLVIIGLAIEIYAILANPNK
ncbi:MAG: DUF3098 domain-containing protein [Flavobacteriaceae bacterium]|jgi:hypothetical protein|nr:DUF3098 domain-containing protein [Flavobacteriaceae bacterium]